MKSEKPFRVHCMVAQHAHRRPASAAILDTDGCLHSYAQMQSAIDEAAGLLREHDVRPCDRIVLVSENCLATTVFIFAASAVDACIVPINARMTRTEIQKVVDHATPRITLYTTGVSEEAIMHAADAKAKRCNSTFGEFAVATHSAVCNSSPLDADGTAVILYTTGTTGDPKGVMLTHANLRFCAMTSAQLRGIVAQDRVYGVLPLTHVFGLASMLMASSHAGACVQLETRFQPERVYKALTSGVTVFPGVPQMHALVMQYARDKGLSRLEDSSLRYVSSGGAPLDPTWKRKAEAFYGVALQNGYGMTECTAGICATSNVIGSSDTSVGPALPGIDIRLDTSIAGAGGDGTGEVLTRGPHVMKGYYNNREETARIVNADGWLNTGDLGNIDEHGNLHIVGRRKELIIRGGFNVYPPEVEAALNDHPDVIQCAVIGRATDNGDEEILAFVQCVDPDKLDTAMLDNFVSERLVSYKRPSRIITTTELPAASTGKVLKHMLLSTFSNVLGEAKNS